MGARDISKARAGKLMERRLERLPGSVVFAEVGQNQGAIRDQVQPFSGFAAQLEAVSRLVDPVEGQVGPPVVAHQKSAAFVAEAFGPAVAAPFRQPKCETQRCAAQVALPL